MGETRVDLLHLLEDLRDAYPGSLEETILTEVAANALDSGTTRILLECDAAQRTLTAVDNGSGMKRRELARYHDVAASTKTRGQGIGFAGVGIKLGLLVCEEVLTETRRGKIHVATSWHMASRHRAPWKWVPPAGLVTERGTAVRLTLRNPLSPLLDPGFLEVTLRRHFQPLLDPAFDDFLLAHYPGGVIINVNGRQLEKQPWPAALRAPLEIRLFRKRKPSALGYLVRENVPLAEERQGLAISTYGKVIKRGWDWLGMTPSAPERVGGLIEVPQLAASLTLNKGDFIRVGARGAAYLAFRKELQKAVAKQLAAWGDARESSEEAPPRELRPLQRDLAHVLEDLSIDFPLLASLVEHRAGGQKRLPLGTMGKTGDVQAFVTASLVDRVAEPAAGQEAIEPRPVDGQAGGPSAAPEARKQRVMECSCRANAVRAAPPIMGWTFSLKIGRTIRRLGVCWNQPSGSTARTRPIAGLWSPAPSAITSLWPWRWRWRLSQSSRPMNMALLPRFFPAGARPLTSRPPARERDDKS